MKLPGRVWIAIHRTQNRWHDLLAVLTGYCNDRSDKTGVPGEGGGYTSWRCALKRRHDGHHRSRNYIWDATGKTTYTPLDDFPSQPWDRTMTPTMRQTRNARRWHAEQTAARRARLREEGLL